MYLDLSARQRREIEGIAQETGRLPEEVLLQAVYFLAGSDGRRWSAPAPGCQTYLKDDAVEARLSRMLGR
jgi:hypothetical protein